MKTQRSHLPGLILGLIVALVLACLAPVQPARATTITVNTTQDELNNDGDCSLREAIQAANTDTVVDACPAGSGADSINLPSGTYSLSLPGADEDDNATGDLDITAELIIEGTGDPRPTISGNSLDRVVHVHVQAPLEMRRVVITNGRTPDGTDDGDGGDGGAIHARSALILTDCAFSGNDTGDGVDGGSGGDGGAIHSVGTLTLNNILVQANATGDGGDSTSGQGGRGGYGAGIHAYGQVSLNDSLVWFNTCGDGGDGLDGGFGGYGGGVYLLHGTLRLNESQVSANWSGAGGDATVDHGDGGQGGHGGGIYNYGGALKPLRCLISNNHTDKGGNGVGALGDGGNGGSGGGIYVYRWGSLSVEDSTFSGNKTGSGGSGGTGGDRGNGGAILARGESKLLNSTISQNEAGQGGGLAFELDDTEVGIRYCTVAANRASDVGGGLAKFPGASVEMTATIIAGNNSAGLGPDCIAAEAIVSNGYNLVENTSNCVMTPHTLDILGDDPDLATRANNGGPTPTHALQAGSPAIDQILDGGHGCQAGVSTDQRGVVRAGGGSGTGGNACDIGAYEYDSGPTVRFETAAYSAKEDDGSVAIKVRLVPAWDEEISVDYGTADGTATNGQDYEPDNGTLTFEVGESEDEFDITLLDDDENEGNETVNLTLSGPTGAELGSPSQATLTINDPDDQPSIKFASSEYLVFETASTATIGVELSGPSPRLVEVSYETYGSDITATPGSDFVAAAGTVGIFPGDLEGSFEIAVLDDDMEEGREFTRIKLTDPVNAKTASPSYGRLTIIDDESGRFIFLPLVFRDR